MDWFFGNSSTIQNTSAEVLGLNETCKGNSSSNGTRDWSDLDNRTSCLAEDSSDFLTYVFELIFSCIDVFVLVGNVLVAIVIYKATKWRDLPGRLLTNHVIAEAGIGLAFLILNGFLYTTSDINIIEFVVIANRIALFVLMSESVQSLAMTLFFLHLAICNPLYYRLYSRTKHIVMFLVISWLVNIVTWMPIVFIDGMFVFEEFAGLPTVVYDVNEQNAIFFALVITVGYIVPAAFIIVSYIRISRQLRNSHNSIIASQSTTKATVQKARGILFVSILFMLTCTPLFVFEVFGNKFQEIVALSKEDISVTWTILTFLTYTYMAVKFPLFLTAFKSYRHVVLNCCCKTKLPAKGTRRAHNVGRAIQLNEQAPGKSNQNTGTQFIKTDAEDKEDHAKDLTTSSRRRGHINDGYTGSVDAKMNQNNSTVIAERNGSTEVDRQGEELNRTDTEDNNDHSKYVTTISGHRDSIMDVNDGYADNNTINSAVSHGLKGSNEKSATGLIYSTLASRQLYSGNRAEAESDDWCERRSKVQNQ